MFCHGGPWRHGEKCAPPPPAKQHLLARPLLPPPPARGGKPSCVEVLPGSQAGFSLSPPPFFAFSNPEATRAPNGHLFFLIRSLPRRRPGTQGDSANGLPRLEATLALPSVSCFLSPSLSSSTGKIGRSRFWPIPSSGKRPLSHRISPDP